MKRGYGYYDSATSALVGAAGAVLSRTMVGTRNVKRRRVVDGGEYQQLTKVVDRFGSRLNKDARLLAMLRGHITTYVDRFNLASLGSATSGQCFLSYAVRNPDVTQRLLPVYLMDLTCMPNTCQNPITGTKEECVPIGFFRRLCGNCDAAVAPKSNSYFTESVLGKNGEDASLTTVTNTWLTEERSVSEPRVGPTSLLNWVDIRMMIYGATDRPSRVQVMLVQFKDDCFVPAATTYGATTANTWYESEEPTDQPDATEGVGPWRQWNDMWDGYTDRLISNPIAHRGSFRSGQYLNVLYSKEFVFNPVSKDEQDARGHMKEFYLRYNMDKMHYYDDAGQSLTNVGDPNTDIGELNNPNRWSEYDRTSNNCYVRGKGRTFLLISGMTMESSASQTTNTGGTATVAPSFDLIVRRKRSAIHR